MAESDIFFIRDDKKIVSDLALMIIIKCFAISIQNKLS